MKFIRKKHLLEKINRLVKDRNDIIDELLDLKYKVINLEKKTLAHLELDKSLKIPYLEKNENDEVTKIVTTHIWDGKSIVFKLLGDL